MMTVLWHSLYNCMWSSPVLVTLVIKLLYFSVVMCSVPVILLAVTLALNVGPSFSSCTTRVRVHNLGCHMQWNCSDINITTTTFTVQTMSQGAKWQNVSHCLRISSYSCDVSEVFKNIELYNFVMLGFDQGHGNMNWTSPELCDPIKDPNASFSPPSLNLSLNEQRLLVEVKYPCAPVKVCRGFNLWDEEDDEEEEVDEEETPACCFVTHIQPQNTAVTVYNKHNMDESQTRMTASSDLPPIFELTPGQEYCAVARLASSPLSDPQCIHVPVPVRTNLPVLALCGIFVALLLLMAMVLRSWCASTELKLPKSLMSLQSQDSSVVDEPWQPAREEEEPIVHLSIISLNNNTLPSVSQSLLQSLEVKYYTTTILQNQISSENVDTDYHFRGLETDSDCGSLGYYLWPRWSSLPALRTGMVCLLGNVFATEDTGIPLSSVRVAGVHVAKTESDCSFI